jgi:WD40 repeat protein
MKSRFGLLLVAAVAVFGIAAAVRLTSADDHPARLAVVDADGRLSTMDGLGGSRVTYDVPGTVFRFPAWSPDGSRIAAVGQTEDGTGVYVFSTEGGAGDPPAPTAIYSSKDQPPFYLYWTPDSRQLTFLTTESVGLALRVAPADASGRDSIVHQGAPMYWTWLDAANLEVHAGSGPEGLVGELGLDGGPVANRVASPGVFRAPAVTRDGRYRSFVLARTDSGSGSAPANLVVAARDGSASHEIPIFGIPAFGFDPTGTALAFIAADEPSDGVPALPVGPLRIVDAVSGSLRTMLDASVVAFFWAPDGRTIASLRLEAPGGIEARSRTGGRLASTEQAARPPGADLAQAGGFALHLDFTDVASGARRSERTVRVSELFVTQLLPYFDQYALSHRLWSPASTSVVLPLVDGGGETGLYVILVDGSEPSRVADAAMGFWSP